MLHALCFSVCYILYLPIIIYYTHIVIISVFLCVCGSEAARLEGLVAQWSRVAVFFTLRLVLAPCVESVLLLDRALFLREQGVYTYTVEPL